jgi:hypothetical protein
MMIIHAIKISGMNTPIIISLVLLDFFLIPVISISNVVVDEVVETVMFVMGRFSVLDSSRIDVVIVFVLILVTVGFSVGVSVAILDIVA